jgi:GTP-binding protein
VVRRGVVDQDLAVADVARKAMCGTIVVLAKWGRRHRRDRGRPPRLEGAPAPRPPLIAVSAKTGRGVRTAGFDRIEKQFANTRRSLDRRAQPFLRELREDRSPPQRAGRRLNCSTGRRRARSRRAPLLRERSSLVTRDYGYWVENRLRERFELEGVPVSIDFVRRG